MRNSAQNTVIPFVIFAELKRFTEYGAQKDSEPDAGKSGVGVSTSSVITPDTHLAVDDLA